MYEGFNTAIAMTDNGQAVETITLVEQIGEVKTKLAYTVRGNAKKHQALTPAHILTVLAKHLPLGVQQSIVPQMSQEAPFRDIKTFVTASGELFLYSLEHITHREAAAKGRLEGVKHFIAEKVRRESRVSTALTPLGAVHAFLPDIKPVQICAVLNEMHTQSCYRDLKTVSACTGELYLYCDLHITEKYAALLARSAVSDACTTIAETVREESRIYPRPTKVNLFTSQVFGIPPGSLQPCIIRLLNNPEFGDIRKLMHPETGAMYLYSNLHMNENHAHSVMKWLEEGAPTPD